MATTGEIGARWARAEDHYPASMDGLSYGAAVELAQEAHADITALLAEVAALAAIVAVLDEYAAAHHDYDTMPHMPRGGKHETPVLRWQARAVDLRERVDRADRQFAALLDERKALARGATGQAGVGE